ncbi:MAG: hypothetical protein AAGF32_09400 [Pseudomonadota bacterium]
MAVDAQEPIALEHEIADLLNIAETEPDRFKEVYCKVQARLKEVRDAGQPLSPKLREAEQSVRVMMCCESQGR